MTKQLRNGKIIRGTCPDFICICCRTKYGWEHQPWCGRKQLAEPQCEDCGYYNAQRDICDHPVHKKKRTEEKNG